VEKVAAWCAKRTTKYAGGSGGVLIEISFTRAPLVPFISGETVNSRRAIALLYVVLLTVFGVGSGLLFMDARAEYNALKAKQAACERELSAARTRLAEQDRFLQRLRTDPLLVEKVVRQRLGYGRPGEVVFRFDNSP
jgi:cell division protein FtsB